MLLVLAPAGIPYLVPVDRLVPVDKPVPVDKLVLVDKLVPVDRLVPALVLECMGPGQLVHFGSL